MRKVWSRTGRRYILFILLSVLAISAFLYHIRQRAEKGVPDFTELAEGESKQTAFFEYLLPYVQSANGKVLTDRFRLQRLEEHLRLGRINRRERYWVREVGQSYGVEIPHEAKIGMEEVKVLLHRVDIIPPSMVLAQAALESGWGGSRFARKGFNLFGTRCYEPGCGIVPKKRRARATYEVRSYRSPRDSILDYVMNLNSNLAYKDLRRLRSQQRERGLQPDGLTVSDGLYRYSSEGWTYVDKVQRMIRHYDLNDYDQTE